MLIKAIKELRAIKKREQVFKGIQVMNQYLEEMVSERRISQVKADNILSVAILEYAAMHLPNYKES